MSRHQILVLLDNFVNRQQAIVLLAMTVVILTTNISAEMIDMKIVDEPSTFGSSYVNAQQISPAANLKLKVQPANFTGPTHFKRLLGRCYSAIIAGYKYNFCPFSNVTQHEQGVHWNPYNGVLGVWQEWAVEDNTFKAMMMKDGESCGNIFRSMKVTFECGNSSKILNVSEPETCKYHMVFQTPLVCHPDSMLVYPTLSKELQHRWDAIEGELVRGELTQKGYKKRLDQIFEKAGIYLSKDGYSQLVKKAEEVKQEKLQEGEFESLETCKAEFKKLQDRVKELMGQLGLGSENIDENDDHPLDAAR